MTKKPPQFSAGVIDVDLTARKWSPPRALRKDVESEFRPVQFGLHRAYLTPPQQPMLIKGDLTCFDAPAPSRNGLQVVVPNYPPRDPRRIDQFRWVKPKEIALVTIGSQSYLFEWLPTKGLVRRDTREEFERLVREYIDASEAIRTLHPDDFRFRWFEWTPRRPTDATS